MYWTRSGSINSAENGSHGPVQKVIKHVQRVLNHNREALIDALRRQLSAHEWMNGTGLGRGKIG